MTIKMPDEKSGIFLPDWHNKAVHIPSIEGKTALFPKLNSVDTIISCFMKSKRYIHSMNRYLMAVILIGSALLTACTSMSPEECKYANWHEIGYSDGKSGFDRSVLNGYVQDCGEAGFPVDQKAWLYGLESGHLVYCMPENGYRVGLAGERYRGVCANEQFVMQYNLGYETYERKVRLEEIRREIDSLDYQLKHSDKLDSKLRKYYQEKRKQLISERNTLLRRAGPTYQYNFSIDL